MSNVPGAHTASNAGNVDNPDFFDTQQLRALSPDELHTELLVLTRDSTLVDIVREAVPRIARITHAPDLDHANGALSGVKPDVLVVDASIAADLGELLSRLTRRFPGVVIVAAGKREVANALMRLTAEGRIFRFLLIPVTHGQARLALGAAIAHHLGLKAGDRIGLDTSSEDGGSNRSAYLKLGLGLLVVISGVWFAIEAFTPKPVAPPVTTSVAPPTAIQPPAPSPAQAELARANEAFAQGNYIEPRGNSALDLYRNALALDPNSDGAQAGIQSVVDKIVDGAEQALTAGRLEEASQSIEMARDIDAKHPRLQFLDIQIARERERLTLGQAQDKSIRVRKLVEQVNQHIEQGRLLRPSDDNARELLQQARQIDKLNPAVISATRQLGGALADEASKSVTTGDMAQAREYIDAARKLGFSGVSLAAAERALSEAGRRSTAAAAVKPAPNAASPSTATATANNAQPRRENVTANVPADVALMDEVKVTPGAAGTAGQILQAAELKRTREVAPDYPTQAAIEGMQGWVDIDFTISKTGIPEDLTVRDAKPKRVFDRAAMSSLRQWRFEPIVEDGVPVARRATLRVRFMPR
jgi:protein TonB